MTMLFDDDLNFDFDADDDPDGAEGEEGYRYGGTEARVFLVDAHRRMFDAPAAGDDESRSFFTNVVNAILLSVKRRIFQSNSGLYSIILYGTKTSKNPNSFEGIYVLQDLSLLDPDRVHELEDLIRDGDRDFGSSLGHAAKEASLGDALWMASHVFAGSRTRLGEKRVFLFTNQEDPHKDDANLRRKALTKAADLKELGIDVTLMPLKSGAAFNVEAFYTDLLQMTVKEDVEDLRRNATASWDELEARMKGLEDKRRRLASLPFHLGKCGNGDPLSFSVGLYSMVREKSEPQPIVRSKRDNKTEVKTVTKKYLGGEDGDGDLLIPSDIKKGIMYGGRNILFEEDELKKIKDFGTPGVQLLGFKPVEALLSHHHIGPSSFLYPDEDSTEGSSRLFLALLERCHLKNKIAVVRIIARQHSVPEMAALIPQMEERREDGFQVLPPGFWVKRLPFSDDFRDVSSVLPTLGREDVEDAFDVTERITKKLTFRFDPRNFENPSLQTMYNIIETMALERNERPEVDDATTTPDARIDAKVGSLCQDWKDLVYPDGYDPLKGLAKRTAPSTGGGGTKKTKTENPDNSENLLSAQDMMSQAEQRKLNKLTVPVLKQFCKANNIKSKGAKKDDFITAINDYYGF